MLSTITAFVRELAVLAEVAAWAWSPHHSAARGLVRVAAASSHASPETVLLVHGYQGAETCWTPLISRLRERGLTHLYSVGYDARRAAIPQLAVELVAAAREAMARTESTGIHLVGYSLGGLIARYAVQQLGLAAATHSVVTIATPHRGTRLANVAPGPAVAQLRPGSALLRELPPLHATAGVKWVVLYSDADPVVPQHRATTGAPATEKLIPGHGHLGIVRAPQVVDVVINHLDAHRVIARRRQKLSKRAPARLFAIPAPRAALSSVDLKP